MDKPIFITDDTALAAYLLLKGMEFIPGTVTNPDKPRRKRFIIVDAPERHQYEQEFYRRTSLVVPAEYYEARARLNQYLKRTVVDPRAPKS